MFVALPLQAPVILKVHSCLIIVPLQMQSNTGSPTVQMSLQTHIDRPRHDAVDIYQGTFCKQQVYAWLHSLQGIWDSGIQVGICLISGGFGRNPAQGLSDPPHMRVHRELMPDKAEHVINT